MIWRSVLILAIVAGASAADPLQQDVNYCQGCRSVVSFARQFNSSDHKDLIRGFCEQYYPASTDFQDGPCSMFVEGLFYVLRNTDPVHHCDEIGACGTTKLPSDDIYDYLQAGGSTDMEPSSLTNDGPICEFCVQIVEQVKVILSDPRTVNMIRSQSEAFCEYLVIIKQDKQCRQIIDKYLDEAERFIKFLDSKAYCRSISMCPRRPPSANADKTHHPLPSLADFNNFGIETSVSIGPQYSVDALQGPKQNGECVLCKTLVKEMFKFLRENKTEANIINGLNRVCHLVYPKSGPGLEQCQGMVKAYTRELVELLIDETDPDVICMILSMCTYDERASSVRKLTTNSIAPINDETQSASLNELISMLDPNIEVGSGRSCIECKMFIEYLKNTLENPESQEEVKQWLLTKLCASLPEGNMQETCTSVVQTCAPAIFRAISGDLEPREACIELGVCNAKNLIQVFNLDRLESMINNRPLKPVKGLLCNSCVDVVTQVDDYLSNHTVDQDINELTKVCNNFLGSVARMDCVKIIKEYGLEIVRLVPTMENPRQLCTQVALC